MISSSVISKLFDLEENIAMVCVETNWLQSLINMVNTEVFARNYDNTSNGLSLLMCQVKYCTGASFIISDYMNNIIKDLEKIEKEVNILRTTLEPGAEGNAED